MKDSFRVSSVIKMVIRDKHGAIKSVSYGTNLRTNLGDAYWNSQLFGIPGAIANWIGITTDSNPPSATDTVLPSEETTNGLQRTAGVVAYTPNTNVTAITATYYYTGAVPQVIAKAGLFNAGSGGTMVLETLLNTPGTVNASGDTLTLTWTITW